MLALATRVCARPAGLDGVSAHGFGTSLMRRPTVGNVQRLLSRARPGQTYEMVVHPGVPDGALADSGDGYVQGRDLERRLAKKQHPPAAVRAALERLTARGLLDDRRFAEQYAAVRATRGKGPARILTDLLAQGVERGVAEAAVGRALEEEGIDPQVEARAAAAKRARQLSGLPPLVRRRRLLAFLVRRGYSGPQVKELVKELCG